MSNADRCQECGGYRNLPRILHDQDEPRECSNAFHQSAEVIEFPAAEPESQTPPAEPAPPLDRPRCPYCGCEGRIRGSMTTLGPLKVFAVYCGNNDCRKYLGFFQPLAFEMATPSNPAVH